LVFVFPFEILQEIDGTSQGIEEINDRGAVALGTFRLELWIKASLSKTPQLHHQ
jgi:hypothetical protein